MPYSLAEVRLAACGAAVLRMGRMDEVLCADGMDGADGVWAVRRVWPKGDEVDEEYDGVKRCADFWGEENISSAADAASAS